MADSRSNFLHVGNICHSAVILPDGIESLSGSSVLEGDGRRREGGAVPGIIWGGSSIGGSPAFEDVIRFDEATQIGRASCRERV